MTARARGFTMVETMVAIAIVGILASAAYAATSRLRPRASLASTAADLTGLLYNARQNALATGRDTVVMIFPRQPSGDRGVGRAVAYEDETYDFFSDTGATNFDDWDASKHSGVSSLNLIGSVEFPRGVTVGLGGAAAPSLPAPYASATASMCNFCSTTGDLRGAVVFDSRGRARFFSANGAPVSLVAGTLAVTGHPDVGGYRMILITPSTGSVRPYVRG